jgi:hypothetical protein
MKRTFLALMLLVGLASGCTIYQIDSKDTSDDFFQPKKSIEDVVYLETVDKPTVEIGIITVTTERRQSLEDILPLLKQEAAILGGDIITDIQSNATGSWRRIKSATFQKILGNAYIRASFSARVLVLK